MRIRDIARRPGGRVLIGAIALATAATVSAPPVQASAPAVRVGVGNARAVAQVHAPVPTLNWHRCQGSLECTRAKVPLDYDNPGGPTIRLNLVKRPADNQATKLGSLFVNPGGPGGPSTEVVGIFAQLLGKPVRDSYDVIGIDPRGVGQSAPVYCQTRVKAPPYPRNQVPLNAHQAKGLLRFNAWERRACATGSNAIIGHMSTADTARDMDLIRQAVGDNQLNYYGISYGTYLGATYAALFPGRVHTMILDGVLDPISWSKGRPGFEGLPFSTRLRSGVGAWDALTSAFAQCDRVNQRRCPLSGQTTEKWLRIVRVLKKGPVKLGAGNHITYSDLVGGTLGALYSRSSYRPLMGEIKRLYTLMFGHGTSAPKRDIGRVFRRMAAQSPGPYNLSLPRVTPTTSRRGQVEEVLPSFEGVACSDSRNPSNPRAWLRAGQIADAQGPWFGRVWTWASSVCAQWPGSSADAYRGPWHHIKTANPVLIVGNFHDPATPIAGARTVNKLFPGSRMFSLNTWGHGAIGESACVTHRFDRYLVDGLLPPNGLVCRPDKQLFPIRG